MTTYTGAGYQLDGGGGDEGSASQKETKTETPPPEETKPEGNPLTALVQERQGRREDISSLSTQLGQLQNQLNQLQNAGQVPKTDGKWVNPHSPTEAPVEHLQAEIQHMAARIDQATSDVTERLSAQDNQNALLDYERGVIQELSLAAAEVPALSGAYNFVQQAFARTAKATGSTGAQIGQEVRKNMLTAFLSGQQHGKGAAEVLAGLAIELGYNPQGEAPKAPPVPPAVKGQQAASQSLGGSAGGGGATVPPNAQALLGMSKAQLRANNKEALERVKAMARGEVAFD